MFGGFQSNGFQSNGFQVVVAAIQRAFNGNSVEPYQSSSHELQRIRKEQLAFTRKIDEVKTEQRAVDYKLEDLEFRRLRDLADENMQLELLLLLQRQQELQNLLAEYEQQRLRRIIEEDDIIVLSMCLPFYG